MSSDNLKMEYLTENIAEYTLQNYTNISWYDKNTYDSGSFVISSETFKEKQIIFLIN